jgi:hypothetical protein
MIKSLIQMLEDIAVHSPGQWENETGPADWYAVSTEEDGGIIAYFQYEVDAFRFRLDYINRKINP